jgi:hypothetical protein
LGAAFLVIFLAGFFVVLGLLTFAFFGETVFLLATFGFGAALAEIGIISCLIKQCRLTRFLTD